MNFLRQNEASWNHYRRKLMNITQDLNSISVCMTVDEFSKQKKSDCTAQRFPQEGVEIHINLKM